MYEAIDHDLGMADPSEPCGAGLRATSGPAQRIAILLHDFSGGGTEHVAIRLANIWASLGRDVRILCGSEDGPTRTLVAPSVRVECTQPEMKRGATSRLRLGKAVAVRAATLRPDIVFAPGNFHLPVLASFAHFDRSGATTVGKISNPLVRRDWSALRRLGHGWQLDRLTARIDCLVAMSPALRMDVRELLPRATVEMCWEPIFGPADCIPLVGDRDPIPLVVAVGRLEKQKNFELALDAMAQLVVIRDARLVILGEGSQRAALERRAARLGIDHLVSLPGHVGDVRPYLARASAFLMTSHYEGYPAALVEAVGHGVPTVVTRCSSAITEIATAAAAARVVAPRPHAIAEALRTIVSQSKRRTYPMLLARHEIMRAAAAYLEILDRMRAERGNAAVRFVSLR